MAKFYCFITFTSRDIGQYMYAVVFFLGLDVINFEINLIFLINLFLIRDEKFKPKI